MFKKENVDELDKNVEGIRKEEIYDNRQWVKLLDATFIRVDKDTIKS